MESPLIGPDCNWVCIACSKLLWNVWTMKWASVWRDSGESHGCCPRSTLLGLWFLIVLPVCHIFTICDKCIMQSLAVFVYFFLWGPWVTLFKMKIDVVGKCTSQGVQCITYYSWRISVSFFFFRPYQKICWYSHSVQSEVCRSAYITLCHWKELLWLKSCHKNIHNVIIEKWQSKIKCNFCVYFQKLSLRLSLVLWVE